MNVKNILFVAFVFLLPIQTVYFLRETLVGGEKWQYGTISLYFSDLVLVALLVTALGQWLSSRKIEECRLQNAEGGKSWFSILKSEIINHKSEASLVMLTMLAFVSVVWAADPALAVYTAVKLMLAAGVFFIARSVDDQTARVAVLTLVVAATLQSGLAMWQFLAQSTFASTILGMSAREAWQVGTSVLKLEGGRWLRAYGTFPHPNMLGGFLAVALVIAVADLKKRDHSPFSLPRRQAGFLHSAFLILLLLALILTFSRAAWLGVALGIGVVAFFQKSEMMRHRAKIILGVLGIAATVFVFSLRDQVFPRFDVATIKREGSVSERMVSLRDAKELIAERPIAGVGAGNFTEVVIENEPTRPAWSIQPAHNVFMLVFAELGVVGLILFIGFLFSVFQSKIFNPKSAILLVLLPSLLFDHWLWSSHFGILLFFLLVGLATRKKENIAENEGWG